MRIASGAGGGVADGFLTEVSKEIAFLSDSKICETLCFSIPSPSPNLDELLLRCDGCETVSYVVGSWADHVRIMGGSVPQYKCGFTCFYVHVRSTEFQCDL